MRKKTQVFVKTTVVAALAAGSLCWSAAADDGAQLWKKNCTMCHGEDGKGQTKIGHILGIKDLTDAKVQASFTDAQAIQNIKEGITDENGKKKMKAFGDKFSDDDLKTLVAHVRSLKK
jgi:cytochrome c6